MMFNIDNNELRCQDVDNGGKMCLLDISNSKRIPLETLSLQQSLNFEKPNEIQ